VKGNLSDVKEEVESGKNQTEVQNSQVPEGGQLSLGLENMDANGKKIDPNAAFDVPDKDKKWQGWSPWFDPGFDKGWGDKGFLVTHKDAGNGRQVHQIWGINKSPKYNDQNQKKVSFGAKTRKQDFDSDKQEVGPSGWGYFAQAEFYYDCDDKWSGGDCNEDDNASFGVRWRARLRRIQAFSLASVIQKFAFTAFAEKINDAVRGVIDGVIGKYVPGGNIFRQTGLGVAVIDAAAGMVNTEIVDPLLEILQGQLDKLSSWIDPTGIDGAYH
jgi:hypothetical protein